MPEFDRIAVVGGGPTADDIARAANQAECQVVAVAPERVADPERTEGLGEVRLVIEVTADDLAAKRALLAGIQGAMASDAILATTTSALSVTDLAAQLKRPERFAGLHFANPDPSTAVVEVVSALQSAPEIVERLRTFATELGKVAVPVKDRPGFLLNRLFTPYLNDVVQAYDDGLATADDLDTAIRLGLGYQRGPLELLDAIGLDVHERTTQNLHEQLQDPAYAPPPLLRAMVAAGRHGDKVGNGFRTGTGSA